MKYETPQMTALTSAVNAIQQTSSKDTIGCSDHFDPSSVLPEVVCGYTDWE